MLFLGNIDTLIGFNSYYCALGFSTASLISKCLMSHSMMQNTKISNPNPY